MKYLKFILVCNLFILIQGISAQNADITCIYQETTRKDVTQPAHTQSASYKNATDITCCSPNDHACSKRLQKSAQEYCKRTDRVPNGYGLLSVKIMCGKESASKDDDDDDTDD